MSYRLAVLTVLAATAFSALGTDDSSLLFRSDFDAYSVKAGIAKGGGSSRLFGEESLQLRMWPGPYGNVNALAYSKSESLAYPLKGNLDPRHGTVSFWVASLGWKPGDKSFQWFLTARQPGFTLHVYKYVWPGYIFFYIETPGGDGKPRRFVASTHVDDQNWAPGMWHKIDAVWDANGMRLYVDGLLPGDYRPKKSAPAVAKLEFPERIEFPGASEKGEIVVNSTPTKTGDAKDERTAIDDIRVYSRPLSAKEIGEAYFAVVPSTFGSKREKPVVGVPPLKAPVVLDGTVADDEWSDASRVPIAEVAKFSDDKDTRLRGVVRVKRDEQNLYVALAANCAPALRAHRNRDGSLWEDDSFEMMLADRSGTPYHFIVNANGALYDDRRGSAAWNSSARCAASFGKSSWSAEVAVPLADVGGMPAKANFALSSHSSGVHGRIDAVSWSYVSYSYASEAAMGSLVATAAPVSIASCGSPESGDIELKVEGNAKFSAFVENENGDKVVSSVAFPSEAWSLRASPGRQRLVVEAAAPNGGRALLWEHLYYVNREIELSYDCHSREGFVDASAALSGALARNAAAAGLPGEMRIARKKDGAVISKVAVVASGAQANARIPLPDLPAGEYLVEAEFSGVSSALRFNVPDLSPLRERPGFDHTVPSPWHEIRRLGARTWAVLDREYAFGDGPFPVRLVSRGSEMFARAPIVSVDGAPVAWSDMSVREECPDVVRMSGRGQAGRLSFSWTGELWFDGLLVVRLSAAGEGGVSSLAVDYAVPREHARYVYRQGYRDGLFEWKDNRIEKTFDPLRHPDSSLHWTSGPEKGVAFGCLSDANWANADGEANIVYARDADSVSFTAKVISRPVSVKGPLSWTFVLQGTPSRSPDPDWRAVNIGGYFVPTMQNRQFGGGGDAVFADLRRPTRWTTPSNFRPKWPQLFLEKYSGKGIGSARKTKSHIPFKSQVYCMPMHVGTNEPEYDYFFHDAVTRPALTWSYKDDGVSQTEYCACDTRLYDILLANMEWFFRNTPEHIGVYNDCAHAKACENARHGHGGVDAFGRAFSSVCWLEQRDYFLREMRLARKYRRTVRNHVPAADFVPFVMDFCDETWPGEELYAKVLENLECYTECVSPESWQSVFSATIRGVPCHVLPQYARASGAMDAKMRKECDFANRPDWAERVLAAALVHDVPVSAASIDPRTVDRWWIIKEGLRLWDAKFHGYWFDGTYATGVKGLYASWYELPAGLRHSRLVVVSNFTREDVALGLDAARLGDGLVHEFWSGRDVPSAEAANMLVPAKRFVLLGLE